MPQIAWRKLGRHCLLASLTAALVVPPCAASQAQLSLSAYRALGQPDLRLNGLNMVGAGSLNLPQSVAVDRDGFVYVADTSNHRVLIWGATGDPQVLGQPTSQQSGQHGTGAKGLSFPWSVAVDAATGNLYVADLGDNRVLRFPKPAAHPGGVEPDAVFGQPDFNTFGPNSGGITEHSMNGPRGVAWDGQGNLWVADAGNHRLLRFPAAVLNTPNPAADLVLGQPDFHSGNPDRGGATSASGFNQPIGLAFDAKDNLYVADFLNTRVLVFLAPVTSTSVAQIVYGQSKFTTRGAPQTPTASSLVGPTGVALDAAGSLYVAAPFDNRVLVFAAGAASGAAATRVLGQPNFTTSTANTGAFPEASATSLFGAGALAVDALGNLLVADSANNRVLAFPSASTAATRVLGQTDFAGNGANQIKPGSINAVYKMAIDYSRAPFALYVSDTSNHRVLVWKDAAHFRTGDAADMVVGQPTLTSAFPNADTGGAATPSPTGLFAPKGIAIAADGTLFVADSGNNRVLRYPRPVDQSGRVTPDAVLGQKDFATSVPATVGADSLHAPAGLAIGPNGHLFVADSGNNRVLEFASGAPTGASAMRVYGQSSFNSSSTLNAVSAQTLTTPQGLYVDAAYNLYVADAGANRVVVYPKTSTAPAAAGLAASTVIGQGTFAGASSGGGTMGLNAPLDVAVDSAGNIFVSDGQNNRVVVYPSLASLPHSGGAAYLAMGQQGLGGSAPNWDTPDGLATPDGLYSPAGILLDRKDTLYVGDMGNNRVVHFLKPVAIVNGATFQATVPVGQGAWCTLYGSGLSTATQLARSAALPLSLGGSQLVVNDQLPAPLYYVSPRQINLVFPYKAPVGLQRIAVRTADTGELLAGATVLVGAYAPGFFTHDQNGSGLAAARNQDGSINGPANPAARGTVVQLFGTGQGPVRNPVADGQPAPLAQDRTLAAPTSDATTCLTKQPAVCVALGASGGGAQLAEIQYSGLAPGLVGVWQINIKIPTSGLLGNTMSVRALIGGANQSNLVSIAVK